MGCFCLVCVIWRRVFVRFAPNALSLALSLRVYCEVSASFGAGFTLNERGHHDHEAQDFGQPAGTPHRRHHDGCHRSFGTGGCWRLPCLVGNSQWRTCESDISHSGSSRQLHGRLRRTPGDYVDDAQSECCTLGHLASGCYGTVNHADSSGLRKLPQHLRGSSASLLRAVHSCFQLRADGAARLGFL